MCFIIVFVLFFAFVDFEDIYDFVPFMMCIELLLAIWSLATIMVFGDSKFPYFFRLRPAFASISVESGSVSMENARLSINTE